MTGILAKKKASGVSRGRGQLADGAKPVAGAAGTRAVEGRVAHAAGHEVRYSEPI
jgi:hypothetical protein